VCVSRFALEGEAALRGTTGPTQFDHYAVFGPGALLGTFSTNGELPMSVSSANRLPFCRRCRRTGRALLERGGVIEVA